MLPNTRMQFKARTLSDLVYEDFKLQTGSDGGAQRTPPRPTAARASPTRARLVPHRTLRGDDLQPDRRHLARRSLSTTWTSLSQRKAGATDTAMLTIFDSQESRLAQRIGVSTGKTARSIF